VSLANCRIKYIPSLKGTGRHTYSQPYASIELPQSEQPPELRQEESREQVLGLCSWRLAVQIHSCIYSAGADAENVHHTTGRHQAQSPIARSKGCKKDSHPVPVLLWSSCSIRSHEIKISSLRGYREA